MKIQVHRAAGSVIIVVLVTVILIGITLGSYLSLVSNQNLSVMRSMAWNNAVAVAEAGIEDAMAHLNYNTTNRTRDSWTLTGTNVLKERMLGTNKYKVYLQATNLHPTNDRPTIYAEGWVINPQSGGFLPRPRVVRVTTTNDALFAKGMVAKGLIDLNGQDIKTDSFDSVIPSYNTGGRYDPLKNRDNGNIATNGKLINVGSADIYGRASTGPGGLIDLGPNGTVGSRAFVDNPANRGKVEPGYSDDDMNVQFPDVRHPYNGLGIIPVQLPNLLYPGGMGGIVDGVNYDYILYTGNYKMDSINGGEKKVLVAGDATLLVTGDVDFNGGNAGITIATNASLNMFVSGSNVRIAGQGVINNTGTANGFHYWGMPTNTRVVLQGNADFTGTIYCPQAALELGGGGANIDDFMGASVSASVKMGGHFNFHYDESLGDYGPRRGYTVNTWTESAWEEINPLALPL